jgi:hypothetical protein
MLLNGTQINQANIVSGGIGKSFRGSTYDATVGQIIAKGETITSNSFSLPPRGLVWVVSKERFNLPLNITGLATLKTAWTRNGVLALTVGVVDPGWDGPLAIAVVNFSKNTFTIKKGDPFFRLLFMQHQLGTGNVKSQTTEEYIDEIQRHSNATFSETFLTLDTLTSEIAEKILGFPRVAFQIGAITILIAFLAITVPVALSALPPVIKSEGRIERVEQQLTKLTDDRITKIEQELEKIGKDNNAEIERSRQGNLLEMNQLKLGTRIESLEQKLSDVGKTEERIKKLEQRLHNLSRPPANPPITIIPYPACIEKCTP